MQDESATTTNKTKSGRPRDPGLEDRVFDAAIEIYACNGWPIFSFEAVARKAGVGKAALYRRWPSRAELLIEALHARWYRVDTIDGGSLKQDLLAIAHMSMDMLTGPYGSVALHLQADAQHYEEVRAFVNPYRETQVRQGRLIVRRAIARGELPAATDPGLIMDMLVGSINNHVASTPQRLRVAMVGRSGAYIAALVDAVLKGVGVTMPAK